MQAAEPIDVAAGAMAQALVTATVAPYVVATAATVAAADMWTAALARSWVPPQDSAEWMPAGRTRFTPMPMIWRMWIGSNPSLLSAPKPERRSVELADARQEFSAYRTAGGHAVAQISRIRKD